MGKDFPKCIAFEISNRCNYAHKECPTLPNAEPMFLKTSIIKDTISYLGSIQYDGTIYFNVFNEPLIDPRLFMLIEYARTNCPQAKVCIYTNGWNLNQQMCDELVAFGNMIIIVSSYTDSEETRLRKINSKDIYVSRITLDEKVKTIYDAPQIATGACLFPELYPLINCKGELALCCRDYEYRHILSDLNTVSISDAITSEYRKEICGKLEKGERTLDTCKRCFYPGWGIA